MNTIKKEPGEILESGLIVAGFAMLGIIGSYWYDYAEKNHSKNKETTPIHSKEVKKVTQNKIAAPIVNLNRSKQNTR